MQSYLLSIIALYIAVATRMVHRLFGLLSVSASNLEEVRRRRIQLLKRQNDPRFDRAVKEIFGDRQNDKIDLYRLEAVPIEDIFEQSRQRVYSFIKDKERAFQILFELLVTNLLFLRKRAELIFDPILLVHILKHIYYNGGLMNHETN